MSVVYMAINEKANKTWAVKEVRKDGKMDFNTVRAGLIAEIETLKKLNHPNLPSIVDVIEDDDSFIIVMDFIEGRSLDVILEETGAQSESNVVEWATQLCDVLGYLHSRTPAIIYRDMKPANVMLKPDGTVMVIDFGTAKTYDVNYGETTGIGTRGYAAPEQYGGLGRTDARTDIYCLGLTMYHMLTNVNPCITLVTNKSIRAVNPYLSRGLDQIILKCTQENPDDRYQSCAELMYDLENYQNLEPLYKRKLRRKVFWFAATMLMSVILAFTGLFLRFRAMSRAADSYDSKMRAASRLSDYEDKISEYEACIEIPEMEGRADAYLGLIQAYKENDYVFDREEEKQIIVLIDNNRDALKANMSSYVDICFEIGKLYWYYYDDENQLTRGTMASKWFQDVLDNSSPDYEFYSMAQAYAYIGKFYQDYATAVLEGSNLDGQYLPLFENLSGLIESIASDSNESEIVRLELIELTRAALQQFTSKFKSDGVDYNTQIALYNKVDSVANSINTTTDKTSQKKKDTLSLLPATKTAIDTAFNISAGG